MAKVTITRGRTPRRNGIGAASADLGVGYPHLYKCLRWLAGDRTPSARKPGRDLENAIRHRYPELVEEPA